MASFAVALEPRALEDVAASVVWYEQQRPGLGEQFLVALEGTLERIALRPLTFPPLRSLPSLRRAVLERFPYGVVYRVDQAAQAVDVVACWHQRRDPAVLVRRLRGD